MIMEVSLEVFRELLDSILVVRICRQAVLLDIAIVHLVLISTVREVKLEDVLRIRTFTIGIDCHDVPRVSRVCLRAKLFNHLREHLILKLDQESQLIGLHIGDRRCE